MIPTFVPDTFHRVQIWLKEDSSCILITVLIRKLLEI